MAKRGVFARLVRGLVLLAVLLAVTVLAAAYSSGAWHVLFPSSEHDTREPYLPPNLRDPAILVFSKTNRFRHEDGIIAGSEALKELATGNGWSTFFTENGAVFNTPQLAAFDVVVFLNATGDMLSREQQQAFESWLEAGGGWLGIHAAGDGSHAAWPWYMENLIGTRFTAHILGPQFQRASVVMENHDHPVAQGVPSVWDHSEEWYSWESSPRQAGFTVLATVDEDSYTPEQKVLWHQRDLRMGDHPVVWSNCVGLGRTVYAAMGHRGESFQTPQVRQLLENAILWALGQANESC
ncbi:MAG: ThuA domain-containing protein [Halieaceae bacterium]